jgi:hypothetical protein
MKPLFDAANPPPAAKQPAKQSVGTFRPMTFGNHVPDKHVLIVAPTNVSTFPSVCKGFDSSLTDVEITRIQRIVLEIDAAPIKSAFATEVITLITEQTEKVFQCVMSYDNSSSTSAIEEFVRMITQLSSYKKPSSIMIFFNASAEKTTFVELLTLLRKSLSGVTATESRFAAELVTLQKKQTNLNNSITTCKNYLRYIKQYNVAGKVFLSNHSDTSIITVVEQLEGVYPATITTAIAQLVLLGKTNDIIIDRIQDIIQFKIPQWKQNAATILVVAEQKKLQGINSDVEANFDALLKLI